MLTAKALSYVLPQGERLFHDLNFTVGKKKYGLVGPNGVGKSTLARILCGELTASHGSLSGDFKALYLPQMEERVSLALGEYLIDIWESGSFALREDFLVDLDLTCSLASLSGGQWMKARLLRAVAQPSALLILDEPTNNLDQEGREALFRFVEQHPGGLLIISHDRELLEKVDEIWELSNQGLSVYGGPFSHYEKLRSEERLRLSEQIEVARREKKKQEREHHEKLESQKKRTRLAEKKAPQMGLPRILLGARKRQAQVSLGKIQREEQVRDQKRRSDFSDLLEKTKNSTNLRIEFSQNEKSKGKTVFHLENFNFRYAGAERSLWAEPLNFHFMANERLALRGGNGSGKTTLLKLLTSDMLSSLGNGSGAISPIRRPFLYLDQESSFLNLNQNLIENAVAASRFDLPGTRNQLADYGFTGESVFKRASVLSGGERLRLCLAKLALAPQTPEIIILDEPTNNLDLESIELLERTLREFQGTLILVSHDRNFRERLNCERSLFLQKK